MATRPPAEIGTPLAAVDTPALVIDLDALERNLDRMAQTTREAGVKLRPHAKTHKCAPIARRQMELGAVGVCCQKVSEAEALIHAGVPDVLVSNEVVGGKKIEVLVGLAREARIAVCVDHAQNAAELSEASARAGVRLDVLIEVNVGADRCGVAPGEPALALARQVASTPSLRLIGLQAYQGKAQHLREFAARRDAIAEAVRRVRATLNLLGVKGIGCDVVAGAGTGTYRFEAASGVYNEVQAGSYVFMDADYGRNLNEDGSAFDEFENSLFVLATVMSRPESGRAVVDAGLKALGVDSGMPLVLDSPEILYSRPSDEHGNLDLRATERRVELGDKLCLIPGHCDPTVNLYDWFVCIRNQRVEALWPIVARGAVY